MDNERKNENAVPYGSVTKDAAERAAEMLGTLKNPGVRKRLKDAAKRILGRGGGLADPIFWPAGMLLLGLTQCGQGARAKEWLSDWEKSGMPVRFVDDAVAGFAMTEIIRQTGDEALLPAVRKIAAFLKDAPKDDEESLIYNPAAGNRCIYADGAGQSALFLASFSELSGDAGAGELALLQLRNFMKFGMDKRSGLPYHGYTLHPGTQEKHGLVGWGRAAGWLLMGAASAKRALPGSAEADEIFSRLLDAVLPCRQDNGLFPWLLPAPEGHVDTSASGMVLWSFLYGEGVSDKARQAAEQAVPSLMTMIRDGRVDNALAECIDFAQHPQVYGWYPWGQGAVLALLGLLDGEELREDAG